MAPNSPEWSFIHESMAGSRSTAPLNRSNSVLIVAPLFEIYGYVTPYTRRPLACPARRNEKAVTPQRLQIASSSSATLPERLFLKALTEGLPMIRPGAVDICRPMMVRYSVIYGVTR